MSYEVTDEPVEGASCRRTFLEWIGTHPGCTRVHRGGKLRICVEGVRRCVGERA